MSKAITSAKRQLFFVNGRPLESFGPQQLYDLVREEVESARATQ